MNALLISTARLGLEYVGVIEPQPSANSTYELTRAAILKFLEGSPDELTVSDFDAFAQNKLTHYLAGDSLHPFCLRLGYLRFYLASTTIYTSKDLK